MNYMRRPYCQPVLPLVYDDSLSYYETLCKVIDRLNLIYSATTDTIKQILDEMGISGDIRYKNVLNVKDYGAKGDGSTDDRMAIQEALTEAKEAGGGIVFVPAGHYIISKCVIVGENCLLIGTGAGSIIDLVDTQPFWGTALGVVGNNSGVCNMKVLYYDYSADPIVSGPAWGAIGCTNVDYYEAVEQRRGSAAPEIENIILSDIYTEGFYSLQLEPVSRISGALYRNLHGAGSMCSIQGATNGGIIENVRVDNCECDYFRILGNNLARHITVTGLRTHYLYSMGSDVHFVGLSVDCSQRSPFDLAGAPLLDKTAAFFNGEGAERCSVTGATIRGRASDVPNVGLAIAAASVYDFVSVGASGFALRNVSGAAGSSCTWTACRAAEEGVVNSPTGKAALCDFGTVLPALVADFSDVYTSQAVTITPGDNYKLTGMSAGDSKVTKNGQSVTGVIVAYKNELAGLVLGDTIATLAVPPTSNVIMSGSCLDISVENGIVCPALFKIDTNGVVSLYWMTRHTPSRYNGVLLNVSYFVDM